jgi:hypothetical protein
MSSVILQINAKPLSTNAKHAVFKGRMIKTSEARAFEQNVKAQLLKQLDKMNYFLETYNKKKHCISTRFYFYIPEKKFFTISDTINEKCLDTSNALKTIEDIIFKMIGIDDSQNVEIYAKKIPYNQNDYRCFIEISTMVVPASIVSQEVFNQF